MIEHSLTKLLNFSNPSSSTSSCTNFEHLISLTILINFINLRNCELPQPRTSSTSSNIINLIDFQQSTSSSSATSSLSITPSFISLTKTLTSLANPSSKFAVRYHNRNDRRARSSPLPSYHPALCTFFLLSDF
jgi:hypothetical protein